MHRPNESLASQQSRSALPSVPTRFLTLRDSFSEYKGVTVGNSGAIWIWEGGLTLSQSQTSFQNSISALYSYRSVQPAPGLLCARCTHGPVLRFIVCAQSVQRCSEQASKYNIQLSDRTGRLWWVTEQNKDGASLDALSLKDVQFSFLFSFFCIMLILSF